MQADIAVVSLTGAHQQPVGDPADTLVFSTSGRDVLVTMVAGKEIYRDGRVEGPDEGEYQTRMKMVRARVDSVKE
jgi:cytosine/adenosine deaminase-related metal-dependent hydrolase